MLLLWFFIHSFKTAQAFTLISQNSPDMKGWSNPEVSFLLNSSACPAEFDLQSTFEEAAKIWNGVPTSNVKITVGGSTTSIDFSSPPTVYCEPNFTNVTGADEDAVPGAGATILTHGEVSSGLLILNVSSGAANITHFDSTKLKVILAHEIGHILGLGHSEDVNALMYFNASLKQHLTLAQDDIDGISYLYPRDEFSKDRPMGCASISSQSMSPPQNRLLILLFLLSPGVLWASLRRLKSIQT